MSMFLEQLRSFSNPHSCQGCHPSISEVFNTGILHLRGHHSQAFVPAFVPTNRERSLDSFFPFYPLLGGSSLKKFLGRFQLHFQLSFLQLGRLQLGIKIFIALIRSNQFLLQIGRGNYSLILLHLKRFKFFSQASLSSLYFMRESARD